MHLHINFLPLIDMCSRQHLHFLHFLLDELDINLKLSKNFNLYATGLPLPNLFFIGTEKVMYFSVFLLNIQFDLQILLLAFLF